MKKEMDSKKTVKIRAEINLRIKWLDKPVKSPTYNLII